MAARADVLILTNTTLNFLGKRSTNEEGMAKLPCHKDSCEFNLREFFLGGIIVFLIEYTEVRTSI